MTRCTFNPARMPDCHKDSRYKSQSTAQALSFSSSISSQALLLELLILLNLVVVPVLSIISLSIISIILA